MRLRDDMLETLVFNVWRVAYRGKFKSSAGIRTRVISLRSGQTPYPLHHRDNRMEVAFTVCEAYHSHSDILGFNVTYSLITSDPENWI